MLCFELHLGRWVDDPNGSKDIIFKINVNEGCIDVYIHVLNTKNTSICLGKSLKLVIGWVRQTCKIRKVNVMHAATIKQRRERVAISTALDTVLST